MSRRSKPDTNDTSLSQAALEILKTVATETKNEAAAFGALCIALQVATQIAVNRPVGPVELKLLSEAEELGHALTQEFLTTASDAARMQ